jgi:hypothetical protein
MSEEKKYDNTNRGALFRNDRKTSDKHPSHKGNATIELKADCTCPKCGHQFGLVSLIKYWLSAWVQTGKGDTRFFSISFQKVEAPGAGGAQRPSRSGSASDSSATSAPAQASGRPSRSSTPATTENLEDDVPF